MRSSFGRRCVTLLLLGLVAACHPRANFSPQTPPLILTSASQAGNTDGRARFREIFCAIYEVRGQSPDRDCDSWFNRLEGEGAPTGQPVALGPSGHKLRVRIVPGIFGKCAADKATPFQDAIEPRAGQGYKLSQFGYDVAAFEVDGRSSSERNAALIADQIAAMDLDEDERLVLIGHSKGMSDLLSLIGSDNSVIPPGTAVVSLSGVVAGTPIADQYERVYDAVSWIPFPNCPVDDRGGVSSLTRRDRLSFLATHNLRADLRYYSIAAFTDASNMSGFLMPTFRKLSQWDPRNDGNVIFHDSIIPGSEILAYPDSDHWAIAMPFEFYAPSWFRKTVASRNHFPRVVLLEAVLRTVEEDISGR